MLIIKKLTELFNLKKTYKDFKITSAILKQTPICYGELFKKLGMEELITTLCVNGKYHYKNIRANKSTISFLDKTLEKNLITTKNKYSRAYKKEALKTMAQWDNLMYAPKIDERITDNVIRILLPTNKEYTSALEE